MPPRALASAMRRNDVLVAGAAGGPIAFSDSPHWGLTPRCRPLWNAAASCLFISGGYSETWSSTSRWTCCCTRG